MSAFFTQLFESIFTPGPTPSLLIATNISFACLQAILFALLIATYSIHFAILSILSAGLWWSINWFVAELNLARAQEENRQRNLDEAMEAEDMETEAEIAIDTSKIGTRSAEVEPVETEAETAIDTSKIGTRSAEVEPVGSTTQLKDRAGRSAVSTEDEWERVSETEKDR